MLKKNSLSLFTIFLLALLLRTLFLPTLALTFGYDQARDAFVAQEILSGDLKILGPPASTPGLFHGVFYYYFLVPAYALGKNPILAAIWTAIFNSLGVFIIYLIGKKLTKSNFAGIISALLFALSFEQTQYAIWLSNPTLGAWTVPLLYLGLWMWTKEKHPLGPIVTAIFLGLSIQSEIFLAYHAVPIIIWLYLTQKNTKVKDYLKAALALAASLSTMILVEIKFGFKGISGVLSLLSSKESVSHGKSLGDFLLLFLNQIGRVYAHNCYPGNIGYGAMLVLFLILASLLTLKNKKDLSSWPLFLVLWLFSHITVASVGGTSTPFLLVGIGPAVSILLGIWIARWWKNKQKVLSLLVLAFVVFGNLSMILKENPHGQTIFSIQTDMTLKNQLPAIDHTYSQAQGKPFSINSITSPLWVNTVWSYLYNWKGMQEYGYLPSYHGKDQVGRLGNNLPKPKENNSFYFLIIEPLQGIPPKFVEETLSSENTLSQDYEETLFNQITVQKRIK